METKFPGQRGLGKLGKRAVVTRGSDGLGTPAEGGWSNPRIRGFSWEQARAAEMKARGYLWRGGAQGSRRNRLWFLLGPFPSSRHVRKRPPPRRWLARSYG